MNNCNLFESLYVEKSKLCGNYHKQAGVPFMHNSNIKHAIFDNFKDYLMVT